MMKSFIKKFLHLEFIQVDNLGVGEWHRDRDYNHGVDEINLWLPFL